MVVGQEVDSLNYNFEETVEEIVFHRPSTPSQALRLLPHNASPSQQDSIIQLYFKPNIISPSNRPDTLDIPGIKGKRYDINNIPTYKDGFFTHNKYLHPELKVTFSGIAGDPIPYRLCNDVFITSTLLICFFVVFFIISRSLHVIKIQLKYFFFNRKRNEGVLLNRDSEMKTQIYVNFLSSFLLAIIFLYYTEYYLPDVFNRVSPYKLLFLNMFICIIYYLIKHITYQIVNWTFFSSQNKEKWEKAFHFLSFIKAICFFPLTLIIVYFNLSIQVAIWIFLCFIFLFEISLTFKTKQIFFNYNLGEIHIILYLCTLEFLPLYFLWWCLVEANRYTIVFI